MSITGGWKSEKLGDRNSDSAIGILGDKEIERGDQEKRQTFDLKLQITPTIENKGNANYLRLQTYCSLERK